MLPIFLTMLLMEYWLDSNFNSKGLWFASQLGDSSYALAFLGKLRFCLDGSQSHMYIFTDGPVSSQTSSKNACAGSIPRIPNTERLVYSPTPVI